MMKALLYALLVPALLALPMGGCSREEGPRKVSLEKMAVPESKAKGQGPAPLNIAVGAMITPKEGFAYYKRLLNYIGKKIGRPVRFVDKGTYAEINSLLEGGKLDAAFVCSGPYVDGHEKFGLELLVVPRANGETVYYSYIIVPSKSRAEKLEHLRGKSFAFTDPQSNTGRLVPAYRLRKMGENPESFFGKVHYTHAHDKSIKAVSMGAVDGAAVDSLIWEYINKINPAVTAKTRIIEKSRPSGIPPFVVRKGIDPELKRRLKEALLGIQDDEKGREILKGMNIDGFVEGKDGDYDSIREMKAWIARQKGGGH